tara:strand:+ start:755 stop:892 length:138 start_codon:yes stop_codon:yes gene_type:complete
VLEVPTLVAEAVLVKAELTLEALEAQELLFFGYLQQLLQPRALQL